MSIVEYNQVKNKIETNFDGLIDLNDVKKVDSKSKNNFFLTRSLAAYSISYFGEVENKIAANSVVDGGQDNGIDAIYFNEKLKILYIVQSKWKHDGKSEPSNGEVKKLIGGIKDLFNQRFDKFNDKVNSKKSTIKEALYDPKTKCKIIIAYTGLNFSTENNNDVEDFVNEMNDTSELVSVIVFNLKKLHESLISKSYGSTIDLNIDLSDWGMKKESKNAYYGQVSGIEVAEWWKNYNNNLFAKNIRELLGDSSINNEITKTIENEPDNFWYYNNGITIVCKKVTKSIAGGTTHSYGHFDCKAISIVNGAQTVGTIGKYLEKGGLKHNLEKISVSVRLISLENSDRDFGKYVARNNNRQNEIKNRDLVVFDPVQQKIQTELAIDGISYHIMRSSEEKKGQKSFDVTESTIALACSMSDSNYSVQAKGNLGSLWDDIDKPPYKILFNKSIPGYYIWRCVQIQRKIDFEIESLKRETSNRDNAIVVHGNRILSHLFFTDLNPGNLKDIDLDFDEFIETIDFKSKINTSYSLMVEVISDIFGDNTVIPILFKNNQKCKILVEKINEKIDQNYVPSYVPKQHRLTDYF